DVDGFARRALAAYRSARTGRGDPLPARTPDLWLAMQSDRVFRIPAIRLLEAQRPHQPRCFAYLFTWPVAAVAGRLGRWRGVEMPFVFGTLDEPRSAQLIGATPAARRLSERVMDAWLAFARSGDPGWPAYDAVTRSTRLFGRDDTLVSDPFGGERRV